MSQEKANLKAGLEEEEEVTDVVCMESHLRDGEMMEVEVGRHNVLLVSCDGVYSAISNQCTHYGAPLSKGVLSGHRVRCPWHGSCFNVKNADLEEYPGIDCLPCHKVKVENSKVYVSVKKKIQGQPKRLKWMGARDQEVFHTVMVLGGGAASLSCAETLRQENYRGRIIMVSRDDLLPYDKTRLSKVMNAESDSLLMRRMEFFHKYDIEVWLRKESMSIDTNKKTVTFDDGLIQNYDQILIATAGVPEIYRKMTFFCVFSCIFAIFFCSQAIVLTGDKMSSVLPYINSSPNLIRCCVSGRSGTPHFLQVKAVTLKSGIIIEADVLIVGIGVNPNSEFLKGSPISMDSKNYVLVDKYMRTNIRDVYCAGDLTSFPLKMAKGQRVTIGHWQTAQAHGRNAAFNMLHREVELHTVPFYWTVLLGRTIRYAGYGEGYTEMVLKGKFENIKFLAFYLKHDEVVAAAGLNVEPAVSVVAERLAEGRVITKAEAMSDDLSWLKLQPL
ncbi:putative apoptosis-inducing factor 3-like [Triplophysa rosa]|uniref:Apoptosis-inducing factor 3-like n=1 Tax=Triplophysa rosa TaxID=992332 RepID=A0A9W7TG51_TRIRA|nr:putative apoptosis-inducing factor 3-like [Triplophysa rosa]